MTVQSIHKVGKLVYNARFQRTRFTCSSSTVAANGSASDALTIMVDFTMTVCVYSRMEVGEKSRPGGCWSCYAWGGGTKRPLRRGLVHVGIRRLTGSAASLIRTAVAERLQSVTERTDFALTDQSGSRVIRSSHPSTSYSRPPP